MALSENDWMAWEALSPKMGLGTAQLGMSYGVAGRDREPLNSEAFRILNAAFDGGIAFLDTAPSYGSSESRIGKYLAGRRNNDAKIISKLILDGKSASSAVEEVASSVARMGQELWGLLAHDEDELISKRDGLRLVGRICKRKGLVRYLGASVYSPEYGFEALRDDHFSVLQVPGNLMDRRAARSGLVKEAVELNKAVFVRSVFLQGLVSLSPSEAHKAVRSAGEALTVLRDFCEERDIRPETFALCYAKHRFPSAVMLLGADSGAQVKQNIRVLSNCASVPERWFEEWDRAWPDDRLDLVDPRRWPGG